MYSCFFFQETVNSHNMETANYIVHVIFVLNSVMKTYLLTNQNAGILSKIHYNLKLQTRNTRNKRVKASRVELF